ncbi:DNA helicase B [Megalops cyprinoides]|uniref:DNA helicase B n=1 Tax=Megalops cyprinoides TaxID=118141 RepID=UPI0018653B09|nr:DNA helicase B [Megalops cyprinoides]
MEERRSSRRERIIVGFIIPKKDTAEEEDSGTEEENDGPEPELLDMTEMNNLTFGGQMIKASSIASTEVNFHDSSKCKSIGPNCGGHVYQVEGRFVLSDPWWEVTCRVRWVRGKRVVQGYPAYRLRSDLGKDGRSVVALFLRACGAPDEHRMEFMQWLPKEQSVDFTNLLETLTDFQEVEVQYKAIGLELKKNTTDSVAGRCVQAAACNPLVMRYLPTLLPRQFASLLEMGVEKKSGASPQKPQKEAQGQRLDVLGKLEEIIRTAVWKLGFKCIMTRETRLIRCEASLEALRESGLFEGIPRLQQNALRVYRKLKDHCRTGSTYMEMNTLTEAMGRKESIWEEETWEALHFLKEQEVVAQDRQLVALRNFYDCEADIAENLSCLLTAEPWHIDLDVRAVLRDMQREKRRNKPSGQDPAAQAAGVKQQRDSVRVEAEPAPPQPGPSCVEPEPDDVELDPDQVRAAEMICANPVTVISGKGGCGKTMVVSLVLRAAMLQQRARESEEVRSACRDFENDSGGSQSWDVPPGPAGHTKQQGGSNEKAPPSEERIDVLLTAPTGRAAGILTKRTKFPAYTLHQVLWSFMNAKKDENGAPEKWKFASVRVLVVDEGSLVCVQILSSILSMLTEYARLQKLVFLGDVRQLPSIAPGNTLHDLFHSLRRVRWAVEMKTNHRAESQLIVKNAGLISEMGMKRWFRPLDYDATVDMRSPVMPSPDKQFILVLLPSEGTDYYYSYLQEAINLLLRSAPGLQDDRSSQFIAFRRKECSLINDLCCSRYSGHTVRDHRRKLQFWPNDKVCCTRNGYVSDRDKERELERERENGNDGEKRKSVKERLCNGHIFFVTADLTEEVSGRVRSKKRYLTLDDQEGREITVLYRELQRECKLRHAWARTIHTFQGSEADTIVYVLGHGNRQTWQHAYTAVTRGQKRVYVVATESGMKSAVEWRVVKRQTRLARLVREALAQRGVEGEEPLSQFGLTQHTPRTPHRRFTAPGSSQSSPMGFQTPSLLKRDRSATPLLSRRLVEAPEESPLACSRLRQLSLDRPSYTGRQLFQTNPKNESNEKPCPLQERAPPGSDLHR